MKKCFVSFLLLFICLFSVNAQGLLRRAQIAYNEKNYLYASEAFQKYYDKKGDVDPTLPIQLANSYYQLNNLEGALAFYKKANMDVLGAQDCYNYANVEYMFGHYDEALKLFSKARTKKPERELRDLIKMGVAGAKWAKANQEEPEWAALLYGSDVQVYGQSLGLQYYYDGVVYAYGDTLKSKKNVDERGLPIVNLSYVSTMTDAYISTPILFSQNLASESHVGAVDFGNNGRRIYYSKLDKVGSNKKSRIYSSYLSEQTSDWTDGVVLPFCIDDFNYAHPAISKDGETMYFSSDASGQGRMDIFKVERTKRGAWGTPRNLGKVINTKGDDVFPYVTPQGVLTFSSNGHGGFGGLDVFWVTTKNGNFVAIDNAMQPINSSFDDFALVINPNNALDAYVSSNREAKGKYDQIYSVDLEPSYYAQLKGIEELKDLKLLDEEYMDSTVLADLEASFLQGNTVVEEQSTHLFGFGDEPTAVATSGGNRAVAPVIIQQVAAGPIVRRFVYDPSVDTTNMIKTLMLCALTFEPIANVSYDVYDEEADKVLYSGVADDNGQIYIDKDDVNVDDDRRLMIIANGGHGTFSKYRLSVVRSDLKVFDMSGVVHLMPVLKTNSKEIQTYKPIVVDDQAFGGAPFEVNQVELTAIGKQYLDAWVALLLENPTHKIKLMIHTDQRGRIDYNFRLSQKRAFKSKSYLIKKGVDHKQIVARGYGERYPLIKCENCTDEEYARNRRVVIELMEDPK